MLGTGLSPRSYAIIEQDMIAKIILSKPEELRSYVEEAADISKYREKRRETEIKIRNTRDNIQRLEDLNTQQQELLDNLSQQIKVTSKYRKLNKELRNIQQLATALKWQKLQQQLDTLNSNNSEYAVAIEKQKSELTAINTELTKLADIYSDQNNKFNELQGNFYDCVAKINHLEQAQKQKQHSIAQLDSSQKLLLATETKKQTAINRTSYQEKNTAKSY